MTAAVWTLIGLLVVSQGLLATALFQLRGEIRDLRSEFKGEIGGLRTEMREGFEALRSEMREGFASQGARIDVQSGRIDALGGRIDTHIDRHAS